MKKSFNKSDKKIKICALMPYPFDTTPSQRFRIEQWQPYLENENIQLDYYSFINKELNETLYKEGQTFAKISHLSIALLRRFSHVFAVRNYDLVFIHRGVSIIGPAFLERIVKVMGIPIIYDFDDSIFMADSSNVNRLFSWTKFVGKVKRICRLSSSVTVGNSYLSEYAKQYNDNVYIIPTSIDTEHYQPLKDGKNENGRVVVGWTGSSTSQYHLEAFEPTLAQLLKKRDDVEIRVISNREPEFKEIPYTWREWSPETEVKEISEIEIGIMPTPDDEWSRGKCALKALQYMALGIPAICTDMGANRDVIEQGKNGFLAKGQEEWLKYFDMLIEDKTLRNNLGDEARNTVVEKYSMEKCAELFADVARKTIKDYHNKN
jgi:glycosyltransferase involved in cell wall biosynthesis